MEQNRKNRSGAEKERGRNEVLGTRPGRNEEGKRQKQSDEKLQRVS